VNSENQILWMVVDGGDFVLGYAMEVTSKFKRQSL
jgi:hypothetical protein